MKRAMLFLVALGIVFQSGAARADVKLGYINSEILKEQLPEFRNVRRQLEQMQQDFMRELSDRESKLRQLKEEFERKSLLLSETTKAEMEADFERKFLQLQEFQQQKFGPDGELTKQQIQLSTPIVDRILAVLEEIAKEDGYDFIFDTVSATVPYTDERFDLTDKVLERMKEDREKEKTGQ